MKRFAAAAMFLPACAGASELPVVLAHPPFETFYACTEHFAGQLAYPGDALGTDCTVQRLVEVNGRMWLRAYAAEGKANEDWYGWHENVLSPCDCEVVTIQEATKENKPGHIGEPPASFVVLKRTDNTQFMIAHVRAISVQKGQKLKQGMPLGKVGNNGHSRNPHVHIGAWNGDKPMQIRFDQTKMKLPRELQPQEAQQGAPADPPRPAGSAGG